MTTELERKAPILAECGDTGLNYYRPGYIQEEWHQDLKSSAGLTGSQGVKVYREMYDNHPVIGVTFLVIQLIARKVKTWVDPIDDTPEHLAAATLCESALDDVDGGIEGLMANALTLLPYGWSWLEKVFKISRGEHSSKLFDSKYNDGAIRWRKLAVRAQESLDRWEIGDHGEVLGLWQRPAPDYRERYIPRSKALHFRVLTDKNNPEGRSFLRWIYTSYHYQKNLQFAEAVGAYRNVAGYPKMQLPAAVMNPNATAEQRAIRTEWEEIVQKMMADEMAGLVVPSEIDDDGSPTGYKFDLISASGKSAADTDPIIKRYMTWIAAGLTSQFILLGMDKVGSFALAENQTEMFSHGVAAVIDAVLQQMNADAFPELCALNGLPRNVAPELKRGDVETPDLTKIAAYLQATVGTGAIIPDNKLDQHLRDIADFPAAEASTARPGAGAIPGMDMGDPMEMASQISDEPKAVEAFVPTVSQAELQRSPTKYIPASAVAQRWSMSPGTIIRLIRNGELPAIRVGQRYRIAEHDVEDFESGGLIETESLTEDKGCGPDDED